MRLKIVTSRDDIEHLKLDFIPTVVVGFFQAGTEDIYMFQYYRLKKYFPMAEFIGCSSENNISNRVPFIDVDGSVPYLFMMIDIKREAFSIQIPTTYKELKLEADKKYSVMMLSSEYDKSIDEAVSHVQHKIGNNVYGAIAGSCLETDERASIFYNGEFIYGGTLFWLMDNAFYHLKGLSIHNFEPVGIDLTVTKVEEKTILEIEEKPALDVIESMMGTLTSESLSSLEVKSLLTELRTLDSWRDLTAVPSGSPEILNIGFLLFETTCFILTTFFPFSLCSSISSYSSSLYSSRS